MIHDGPVKDKRVQKFCLAAYLHEYIASWKFICATGLCVSCVDVDVSDHFKVALNCAKT